MTKQSKFVRYDAAPGLTFRARVVTRHRDGGITVEPYHRIDPATGQTHGCFIGGRVGLYAGDFTAEDSAALSKVEG